MLNMFAKKTQKVEKSLYEIYNALFFNASTENDPLKSYDLFVKYLRETEFSDFKRAMKEYDVEAESYRLWVKTWRQNYKHLTKAIRLTKKYRKSLYLTAIGATHQSGVEYLSNTMNGERKELRQFANALMEIRMEAKEARKAFLASQKKEIVTIA